MKFIQSFWSTPIHKRSKSERISGGWPSERAHAISWALSLSLLKQYDLEVDLITDDVGCDFLIDKLNLDYNRVSLELNEIENVPPSYWALGKLKAYSIQNEPFLHVDSDVFTWNRCLSSILNQDVILQSRLNLKGHSDYGKLEKFVQNYLNLLPPAICEYWQSKDVFYFANAGICGGQDYQIFQTIYKDVLSSIRKLAKAKINIPTQWLNMILEEHHIFCRAENSSIDISYLYQDISYDFNEINNISLPISISPYIHFAGAVKKNPYACQQIESRLKYHDKELYESIDELYSADNTIYSDDDLDEKYRIIDSLNKEDLLKVKLGLSAKVKEYNRENEYLVYVDRFNEKKTLKLEENQRILGYFRESHSINDLITELLENNVISTKGVSNAEDILINVVCDNIIYENILDFV